MRLQRTHGRFSQDRGVPSLCLPPGASCRSSFKKLATTTSDVLEEHLKPTPLEIGSLVLVGTDAEVFAQRGLALGGKSRPPRFVKKHCFDPSGALVLGLSGWNTSVVYPGVARPIERRA